MTVPKDSEKAVAGPRDVEMAREWLMSRIGSDQRLDSLATLLTQVRAEERERCGVIADSARRAEEGCQVDGGCRHVPCITARQIGFEIRLGLHRRAPRRGAGQ